MDFTLIAKGKKYYFYSGSNGRSWSCEELGIGSRGLINCGESYCIDAIKIALYKLGYDEYIVDFFRDARKITREDELFDCRESEDISVKEAEKEFNRRAERRCNGSWLGYDATVPIYYDDEEYLGEEERVIMALKEHVGWHVSQNTFNHTDYIDRQHMCVVCRPNAWNIRPNWRIEFRNPDMLGLELNMDKLLDDIAIEMANEELEYLDY